MTLEDKIFERVYQSYITGGDIYTYNFKNATTSEIEKILIALKNLENQGLIEILMTNEKRARMSITPDGINHGNSTLF